MADKAEKTAALAEDKGKSKYLAFYLRRSVCDEWYRMVQQAQNAFRKDGDMIAFARRMSKACQMFHAESLRHGAWSHDKLPGPVEPQPTQGHANA
jgi:hypothetical protein